MILRIPKISEREMEAKPVFSGAKSARSIQNDQKTRFLFPERFRSPGSVGYFHLVIFTKSISLKTVAGGSNFFPYTSKWFEVSGVLRLAGSWLGLGFGSWQKSKSKTYSKNLRY